MGYSARKNGRTPFDCETCPARLDNNQAELRLLGCGWVPAYREAGPLEVIPMGNALITTHCPGYLYRLSKVRESCEDYAFTERHQPLTQNYGSIIPDEARQSLLILSAAIAETQRKEQEEQQEAI